MAVFFSVVIPALNEEMFLPHLLDCLSHQTTRNFEVIVADGNSQDRTVNVARGFAKKLPRLTVLKVKNGNVSLQRNTGAAKARGKYLVFFDADVKVGSDFLESIERSIAKNHQELLTTDIASETSGVLRSCVVLSANILRSVFTRLGKPTAGGYNIIVKKSTFFRVGGFDEGIVHGEDVIFLESCYKQGIILASLSYPKQIFSFRRYEKYGFVRSCAKMIVSTLYYFVKGPVRKELFSYPMGGKEYGSPDKR